MNTFAAWEPPPGGDPSRTIAPVNSKSLQTSILFESALPSPGRFRVSLFSPQSPP